MRKTVDQQEAVGVAAVALTRETPISAKADLIPVAAAEVLAAEAATKGDRWSPVRKKNKQQRAKQKSRITLPVVRFCKLASGTAIHRTGRICFAAILLGLFVVSVALAQSTPSTSPEDTVKRVTGVLDQARQVLDDKTETENTKAIAKNPVESPAPSEPETSTHSATSDPMPIRTQSASPVIIKDRTDAQVPTDSRFWKYRDKYLNHSVLSLIVNGDNREHLLQALDALNSLRGRNLLLIGRVIVVGSERTSLDAKVAGAQGAWSNIASNLSLSFLNLASFSIKERIQKAKLIENTSLDAIELIRKLDLQNSPTWVVRYRGEDYIYEGHVDPKRLFGKDGSFRGGKSVSSDGGFRW